MAYLIFRQYMKQKPELLEIVKGYSEAKEWQDKMKHKIIQDKDHQISIGANIKTKWFIVNAGEIEILDGEKVIRDSDLLQS